MKIGIIGVGLLGSSLSAALKRKYGGAVTLSAFSSPRTLEKARKTNLFNNFYTYDQIITNAGGHDFLFLCTPINIIKEHLKIISNISPLEKPLVVTDIGSTKREVMETAQEYIGERNDLYFIGGHPMTGNEFKGFDAMDEYLYENAIYVITPEKRTPNDHVNRLLELVKAIGALPIIMEPSKHDRVVAGISHLPQLLATGLVDLISKEENPALSKTLCAGGFRDMTRIASSQYKMWEDIIATNKENIFGMIDAFINELQLIKSAINNDTLAPIFDNASHTRDAIPKSSKGVIVPTWEAKIRVSDKPGTLLQISTILAEEGINVKDIRVEKNREHEGGHFRLSFSSESDRDSAIKHLQFKGFFAREIE